MAIVEAGEHNEGTSHRNRHATGGMRPGSCVGNNVSRNAEGFRSREGDANTRLSQNAWCWMPPLRREPRRSLPDNWAQLTSAMQVDPNLFVTPDHTRHVGDPTNVTQWADFIYVPGVTTGSPPDAVVAYLPPGQYKHFPALRCSLLMAMRIGSHRSISRGSRQTISSKAIEAIGGPRPPQLHG